MGLSQGKSEVQTNSHAHRSLTTPKYRPWPLWSLWIKLTLCSLHLYVSEPTWPQEPLYVPFTYPSLWQVYLSLAWPGYVHGFSFLLPSKQQKMAARMGHWAVARANTSFQRHANVRKAQSNRQLVPCHTDREKESTCRVAMPLWHSKAEHLPHPGCWPPAEAQIICLQGLCVVVGDRTGPQGLHWWPLSNPSLCEEANGHQGLTHVLISPSYVQQFDGKQSKSSHSGGASSGGQP